MKTLADLKRALTPGRELTLLSRFGREMNQTRKVVKLQTNAVVFNVDGKTSWLTWPKASLLEFDGEYIKTYGKGTRPMTAEEQAIKDGYEKIRNMEQEKIDMLSDGSTSYYQAIRYYTEKDALYLMGHEFQRGLKFDWNTGLILDESIKGKLELVYRLN